jgi:hypothetical protein
VSGCVGFRVVSRSTTFDVRHFWNVERLTNEGGLVNVKRLTNEGEIVVNALVSVVFHIEKI